MADAVVPEKLKKTSLYLPQSAHRELKQAAVGADMTISELLFAAYSFWKDRGAMALERPPGCRPR